VIEVLYIYMCENIIMKPVLKTGKKGVGEGPRKSNRGDKFDQSTSHACVENHNEIPFV
jgi:hypothetical protein